MRRRLMSVLWLAATSTDMTDRTVAALNTMLCWYIDDPLAMSLSSLAVAKPPADLPLGAFVA